MSKRNVGLSEPAYKHILELIMTKRLMPGDRIPETRIAEEFNISRTPVRDAMRQLSNEGLIEIFPNRFAQVKVYGDDAIQEIGTVRVALDTMSVKLAGLYGSRADFLHPHLQPSDVVLQSQADVSGKFLSNDAISKQGRQLGILRLPPLL